jgi:hypothetical protein
MPTIYDIDFSKVAPQMLPPDKRFTKTVTWVKILLSPLQYLRDIWFGSYRTGSNAAAWVNSTPYAKYALVKYSNKIIYESLVNNNTALPTDVNYWRVAQLNFIGLSERILYNGQKLVLEYALNKWFGTTFRQPQDQSDIYISNNTISVPSFRVGVLEQDSSIVGVSSSTEYVGTVETFNVSTNFAINCPLAVYEALDPTLINNEKIFRAFVDLYIPAGVTYSIQTY